MIKRLRMCIFENMDRKKLLDLSSKIRKVIDTKQKDINLSFVEDTHTYYIKTLEGNITTKFPSVSTVIKQFYNDFPALEKSLSMSNGDIFEQDKLLKEWRGTADYANSKGSRVHYLLEKDLLSQYGSYKEVRMPIFDCDEKQTEDGNAMIDAGHDFINLMHRRGAVLLDTEMVLGSNTLKYTGQPDKVWLMSDKEGNPGIVITDWKGLPIDTPILTSDGWKTMGALNKFDQVYDKDGDLVNIMNISKVKNVKCLKLKLDNGEEIVSDFEHRWLVIKNEAETVMTTQEIFNHLNSSNVKDDLFIPMNKSIKNTLESKVDNYKKGLSLEKNGFESNYNHLMYTQKDRVKMLRGVIKSSEYEIININYVINCESNEKLTMLKMLTSSLGLRYNLNGNTITFNTDIEQTLKSPQSNIKIINVTVVDSTPTKCIEVDSPSSTFLCGHGLLVTHNTNKIKNFKVHSYTKPMLKPFNEEMDTALGHYKIQLPLYGRLLLDMLKGTEYENIKLLGCVIVHLTEFKVFTEYRIPSDFINTVMTMDPLPRIAEVLKKKKQDIIDEENRVKMLNENLGK